MFGRLEFAAFKTFLDKAAALLGKVRLLLLNGFAFMGLSGGSRIEIIHFMAYFLGPCRIRVWLVPKTMMNNARWKSGDFLGSVKTGQS